MQLIYRWNIGNQILDASLQKVSHFLSNPSLFARNANRGTGEGGDGDGEEGVNDEDAIFVAMDVKRMKASTNGSLHDQKEENDDDDDNGGGKTKKGRRGKKGKNTRSSSSAQADDRFDGNDEQQQQPSKAGTQLRISLSQSLAILQAVIDDSISQSASYAPDLLTRTLSVLQPLLSSLQHYAFPISPSSSSSSSSPSPSVMDMYFRLISLKVRIEIFQSVTHSLAANAKMMEARLRASEKGEERNSGVNGAMAMPLDVKNNPLVGKVPSTLVELRELLYKQMLTIDDLGM